MSNERQTRSRGQHGNGARTQAGERRPPSARKQAGAAAAGRPPSGGKPRSRKRWRTKRQRRKQLLMIRRYIAVGIMFFLAVAVVYLAVSGIRSLFQEEEPKKVQAETVELKGEIEKMSVDRPPMEVKLLTQNPYSRPGKKLKKVKGIVIHYVGNPGTTAAQNRSYFESLKDTHEASASSHFVVGIEGEIVQCIPTTEIAYCSNQRNDDTIAIECCHKKSDGRFTQETYDSLVQLTAYLCCKYDLEIEDIIRHYDVTGKECPKYFVVHEEKWTQFKKDVAQYIEKNSHT